MYLDIHIFKKCNLTKISLGKLLKAMTVYRKEMDIGYASLIPRGKFVGFVSLQKQVILMADSICRPSPSTAGMWMSIASISTDRPYMAVQQISWKGNKNIWKQWISLLGREFISVFPSIFRTHPILLGNKINVKRRENAISTEAARSSLSFTQCEVWKTQ